MLRKKKVELGLSGEERAEILSGLTKEDKVVSSWNNEMFDGAKVKLQEESSQEEKKEEPVKEESVHEESSQEEKG